MNKAAALLRNGGAVLEAARASGYGAEAAFSKAFKRVTGRTPGSLRRR